MNDPLWASFVAGVFCGVGALALLWLAFTRLATWIHGDPYELRRGGGQ